MVVLTKIPVKLGNDVVLADGVEIPARTTSATTTGKNSSSASPSPSSANTANDTVILVIPGNPGLVLAYEDFLERLHAQFEGRVTVCMIGHVGHSLHGTQGGVWSFAQQIQHKISYADVLARRFKNVVLVGHSIGGYICLKVLEARPNMNILHTSLVFPTIECMREAAGAKNYMVTFVPRHVLGLVWGLLGYAPAFVRRVFLGMVKEAVTDITMRAFRRDLILNMLYMAKEEFRLVNDISAVQSTVQKHSTRIFFAYSRLDPWVPNRLADQTRARFPGAEVHVDQTGIPHGFATNPSHSRDVADLVALRVRAVLGNRN